MCVVFVCYGTALEKLTATPREGAKGEDPTRFDFSRLQAVVRGGSKPTSRSSVISHSKRDKKRKTFSSFSHQYTISLRHFLILWSPFLLSQCEGRRRFLLLLDFASGFQKVSNFWMLLLLLCFCI